MASKARPGGILISLSYRLIAGMNTRAARKSGRSLSPSLLFLLYPSGRHLTSANYPQCDILALFHFELHEHLSDEVPK